jgi:hypothetical protein
MPLGTIQNDSSLNTKPMAKSKEQRAKGRSCSYLYMHWKPTSRDMFFNKYFRAPRRDPAAALEGKHSLYLLVCFLRPSGTFFLKNIFGPAHGYGSRTMAPARK